MLKGIIQTAVAQVTQDFLQTLVAFQTATMPLEPMQRERHAYGYPHYRSSPASLGLRPAKLARATAWRLEYRLMSPSQMTQLCNLVNASPKLGAWSIKDLQMDALICGGFLFRQPDGCQQTQYLNAEVLPGQSIE
jgi:hypothetical protein